MKYILTIKQYKTILEQFEVTKIQKYWDRIKKETGFEITDTHLKNEEKISGGLKFENGEMDPETLNAFKNLQKDCKGLKMDEDSYRSYDKQTDFFIESVKKFGSIEGAMRYRAIPGFSQHHTGKAIDLEKPNSLRACARKNANKYGFEFPYAGDGIRMSEPWHMYYNK